MAEGTQLQLVHCPAFNHYYIALIHYNPIVHKNWYI